MVYSQTQTQQKKHVHVLYNILWWTHKGKDKDHYWHNCSKDEIRQCYRCSLSTFFFLIPCPSITIYHILLLQIVKYCEIYKGHSLLHKCVILRIAFNLNRILGQEIYKSQFDFLPIHFILTDRFTYMLIQLIDILNLKKFEKIQRFPFCS